MFKRSVQPVAVLLAGSLLFDPAIAALCFAAPNHDASINPRVEKLATQAFSPRSTWSLHFGNYVGDFWADTLGMLDQMAERYSPVPVSGPRGWRRPTVMQMSENVGSSDASSHQAPTKINVTKTYRLRALEPEGKISVETVERWNQETLQDFIHDAQFRKFMIDVHFKGQPRDLANHVIQNAVDAIAQAQKIQSPEQRSNLLTIELRTENENWIFEITDDANGIPEEMLSKVGEVPIENSPKKWDGLTLGGAGSGLIDTVRTAKNHGFLRMEIHTKQPDSSGRQKIIFGGDSEKPIGVKPSEKTTRGTLVRIVFPFRRENQHSESVVLGSYGAILMAGVAVASQAGIGIGLLVLISGFSAIRFNDSDLQLIITRLSQQFVFIFSLTGMSFLRPAIAVKPAFLSAA